jgi:hypothetical protein
MTSADYAGDVKAHAVRAAAPIQKRMPNRTGTNCMSLLCVAMRW